MSEPKALIMNLKPIASSLFLSAQRERKDGVPLPLGGPEAIGANDA